MNLRLFFFLSAIEEEKETMVELKTETNKNQKTGREKEDERDMLSELPDDVLLHIMHFMNTKTAVGTSLLSKRWNNVWKCLPTLCFSRSDFKTLASYYQFVHHVFSHRATSVPLHRLYFEACDIIARQIFHLYTSLLHYVPHLRIFLYHQSTKKCNYSIPFIFSSPSLTSLTLILSNQNTCRMKLPQSLKLPALKTLNLTNVCFTARDSTDERAEPFSSCFALNSLVLVGCSLSDNAEVLIVSNSNLSRFIHVKYSEVSRYKIVLSTPNLTHFGIRSSEAYDVSSTRDLALLEEANIDITDRASRVIVLRLLKMLSYVKILTLSECVLKEILSLSYFEHSSGRRIIPLRFVRLQTLKGKNTEQIEVFMKYFQNSQKTEVEVINF